MKLFYILAITRHEIFLVMREDRTTLQIDDIRKYMLIYLNAVIYINVFTQINNFPNLNKLNQIRIV